MSRSAKRAMAWTAAAWLLLFGDSALAKWADLAGEDAPPEQKAFLQELDKLHWVTGPATVPLKGNASMQVPEGYVFLNPEDCKRFLELNQNLGNGNEYMIAPDDLSWSAYFEYLDEGYVKDDEKLDPDAILKNLTEGTEAANAERRKRGWDEMHVVGWAIAPNYNKQTKRLEWATTIRNAQGQGVNFFTKILGRRGHTSIVLVANPDELETAESNLNDVLAGFTYQAGETYADFKPGDRVAEYGLAALVAGGAAAVAAKKGFFGAIAAFFAAAWKVIVAAAVAAVAWLRKLFAKKE